MSKPLMSESSANAQLIVPRSEAETRLREHVKKAIDIKSQRIRYPEDLMSAREQKLQWTAELTEMLLKYFNTDAVAEECNTWVGPLLNEHDELSKFIDAFDAEMNHRIGRLQLVLQRLGNFPTPAEPVPAGQMTLVDTTPRTEAAAPTPAMAAPPATKPAARTQGAKHLRATVIVHHGAATNKDAVGGFLEKLGLQPLIIDAGGAGKSVPDQLAEQMEIGFAVILAGADEIGHIRSNGQGDVSRHALNLAFELGCCAGRVSSRRVLVMYAGGTESFSDDLGISYLPIDPNEGWQLRLARQMRRGGFDVDLNRLC